MARSFDDLEKEIRASDSQQKATLAHILIQELDSSGDEVMRQAHRQLK